MARVSASDQLTRLLALPAWVAEHPGVTVAEAAEHFGVTPAVIERDVNTLWVSGLPGGMHGDLVDFDAADFEAGRLRLSEPLGLDRPVRLTRQEAISLLMALRVLADLLADDEASAPVIASTQQAVTALLSSGASTEDSDARVDPGTVTSTGPDPAHAGRSSHTSRLLTTGRSALQNRRWWAGASVPRPNAASAWTGSPRLRRSTPRPCGIAPHAEGTSPRPTTPRATDLAPRWFSNPRAAGSPSRSRTSRRRRPRTDASGSSSRDATAPGSSAWSSQRVAISWRWSPRTSPRRRQHPPNRL